MSEEFTSADFKYLRTGWSDLGRPCDALVKLATSLMPGNGVLPPRWSWRSPEKFQERHGHLGMVLWAKTASYHLLMINGHHVLRLWTDSPRTCIADVCEPVAAIALGRGDFEVTDVPTSCERKSYPLRHRVKVVTVSDVGTLIRLIKEVYGI